MKKRFALMLTALVCLVTLLAALRTRNSQTDQELNADSTAIVSVPEPVTLLLLGSGLVALTAGRLVRRKPRVTR